MCVQSLRCAAHEGIRLEMWPQQLKMKQAVHVIVALHRMKHLKPRSSEFGEDELLDMLMEDVIDARRVSPESTTVLYQKTNQVINCSVCDQFKKTLIHSGSSPHLQAVTLKAGESNYKVRFSMSLYMSVGSRPNTSQPVCLGISKSNLYLACTKPDGMSPQLVLQEVTAPLNTISSKDASGLESLLFLRSESGVSVNSFESVKYPGWFISTAFEERRSVEMDSKQSTRVFGFNLLEQTLS
ncbi:hypothetical protein DNTS_017520 [Danionella cerebrum]|uniref:Interleukin-1 n=1 Tax=Danionella cerebrum TaxID=2873325 RepID=A0A553QQ15_9TELE|nr:hypothetical protein DNTS_017520 [Danionella translucida]